MKSGPYTEGVGVPHPGMPACNSAANTAHHLRRAWTSMIQQIQVQSKRYSLRTVLLCGSQVECAVAAATIFMEGTAGYRLCSSYKGRKMKVKQRIQEESGEKEKQVPEHLGGVLVGTRARPPFRLLCWQCGRPGHFLWAFC